MEEYDLVILGGGSAGYNGAAAACAAGLRVAVVDGSGQLGGLCILRGCMPSKALLESANRYATLRRADEFGLSAEGIGWCRERILERKNALIKDFADYRAGQLASGRFALHRGYGRFTGPHTLAVDLPDGGGTVELRARAFLLATGSRIRCPDIPGLHEAGFLNSDDVLEFRSVPKSVVIFGGGAIGVEFAHLYSALGVEVTLLQRNRQLLKEMDGDVAAVIESAYRKRGVKVYTHADTKNIERTATGKRVTFSQHGTEHTVEAEEIICCAGREPDTSRLDLAKAGLDETGRVYVNCSQQTRVPHIFAAGDVAGPYEIVHIAIQQAELAVRNIVQLLRAQSGASVPPAMEEIDYRLRVFAVFSAPEVAMVGFTQHELEQAGIAYRMATYAFEDHGKSMLHGETEGFVKLLAAEESGEILGGAVVGPHASELIHEIVVAMRFRATAHDLARIPHYHPTLSEIWTYPAEELG